MSGWTSNSTTVDIIFGDNSSYSLKENVNVKVLKYKSEVEKWCPKDMNGYFDVSNYVNVILAIMMVESGGEGNDPSNLLNVQKIRSILRNQIQSKIKNTL